ncbi:hypothetical protein GF314_15175, partial [bacterium]|nr:hypothetical protein [bacterium]
MREPIETTRYFFVDESGDTTFFDRYGNPIIGEGGCSAYLLIGYIRTEEPDVIRRALASLRSELAADPLYNRIPSFTKTAVAFHAKDDSPEVRSEVFKLLRKLPLRAQFIFARKRLKTFKNTFHSKESAFYDHLVTHLFKRSLHLATENHIYFEKRGSRPRQIPLNEAVERAAESFREMY